MERWSLSVRWKRLIERHEHMSSAKALTHTFSNGLTLAADIRPSTRAAAFRLLMPTGSAGDPDGKEGLSGALWELCYRGAGSMDSRALSDAMDDIGMQRGSGSSYNSLSGSDSETISFGGAVMSENLYTALDLTADIVLRPALDPDELESVRSGELQELASLEDDPQRKMWVHLDRAYFTNEYGRFRTEESLRSLTAEDMVKAHQTRFKPNGAVLSVSGAVRMGTAEGCGRGAVRRLGWVGARSPSTDTARRRLLSSY